MLWFKFMSKSCEMNATEYLWWQVKICSGNGLVPSAITWTNIDLYLCRHMVPLGNNELIASVPWWQL